MKLHLPNKPFPKIIALITYTLAVFVMWPFLLGYWLFRIIRRSVRHRLAQAILVAIVIICSVGFGAIWVSAIFSPNTYKANPTQQVSTAKDATAEIPTVEPVEEKPTANEAVVTPPTPTMYSVADVVDGDTLKITDNGSLVTIRVIGVDTPETVDSRKPVQCFGKEASDQAKTLLSGKKVSLTPDPTQDDKDKYDRLLRYISLEDGADYGLIMITDGYAHEYTYNTPYERQAAYKKAEKDASTNNKGLWATTSCNGDTTKAATSSTPATSTPAKTPTKTTTTPKETTTTPATTSTTSAPKTNTTNHTDKDCKDFTTHAEAQAYFDSMGGSASNNIDGLDADHDGLVCESLK